jgi:hypothetical protein
VESTRRSVREFMPSLGSVEEDWFAEGMHESAFATWVDEGLAGSPPGE